jgi:hypothetical protein
LLDATHVAAELRAAPGDESGSDVPAPVIARLPVFKHALQDHLTALLAQCGTPEVALNRQAGLCEKRSSVPNWISEKSTTRRAGASVFKVVKERAASS